MSMIECVHFEMFINRNGRVSLPLHPHFFRNSRKANGSLRTFFGNYQLSVTTKFGHLVI